MAAAPFLAGRASNGSNVGVVRGRALALAECSSQAYTLNRAPSHRHMAIRHRTCGRRRAEHMGPRRDGPTRGIRTIAIHTQTRCAVSRTTAAYSLLRSNLPAQRFHICGTSLISHKLHAAWYRLRLLAHRLAKELRSGLSKRGPSSTLSCCHLVHFFASSGHSGRGARISRRQPAACHGRLTALTS